MKKSISRFMIVFLLVCISGNAFGITLFVNQDFNVGQTYRWTLNVGSNANVRIYWTKNYYQNDTLAIGTEYYSNHVVLSGSSGTLVVNSGTGLADLTFKSHGEGYLSRCFQIDYFIESPALYTSQSLTVGNGASITGNTAISQSLTVGNGASITGNTTITGGTTTISGATTISGTFNATTINSRLASTSSSSSYLSGSLGVGITSPSTKLHVYNATTLGSTTGDYVALTRTQGNSNTPFMANDFVVRDSTGSTWNTTSYLKGISISTSYLTPSTLRSWIKQSPYKERIDLGSSGTTFMSVGSTVGIGTTHPNGAYKLDVYGTIHSRGIIVDLDGIADYVFKKNYKLLKLTEVEQYIKDNGHLPDVPSDADVKANGLNMVDMQTKLLQKIEELTLYVIDQQKKIDNLEKSLDASQK